MNDTTEYVRPGTCVWRMGSGHGCGRDAVRFLRVVPGEPRWYVCGIHAAVALREMGRG
jgi:hypothetical protein